MNHPDYPTQPEEMHLDLRDPAWAALLGWLWPGAGHLYQRRIGKGILFMVCILGTYFYGLSIGGGRVVYASWRPHDHRWQYFCQLGTGIPAFPAIVQTMLVQRGYEPFWVQREFVQYEKGGNENGTTDIRKVDRGTKGSLKDAWMAPPPNPVGTTGRDVLAVWHEELRHKFELGTLFTVVAGLLNILAIYDAFAGPAFQAQKLPKQKDSDPDEDEPSTET